MTTEIVNGQSGRKAPFDDFEKEVRRVLKRVLPSGKRSELAAALSEIMGPDRKITKAQLDNFVAEGKCQPRLPLSLAKALCRVVDAPSLRRYLNNKEDLALIEIGEHARANQRLVSQIATPRLKRGRRSRKG